MRLLLVVLVCLYGLCCGKSLNNPLSSLMGKDVSQETKAFLQQVLNTVATHVTFSAIGFPPSLEDFKNDMANITIAFSMLPLKDQKYIYNTFKELGEDSKKNVGMPADFEMLEARMNSVSTRDLFKRIEKDCKWQTETKRCLGLVREVDPEIARVVEEFLEQGMAQYRKIQSKASRDFVAEAVDYVSNNEMQNEISDKGWEHIKAEFAKLSHPDKVEVVRKMTWFMDPVFEKIHSMMLSGVANMEKPKN